METFSVQHEDMDHAIKEALVLFTKHLLFWAGLQPVRTTKKCESNWFVYCFFMIIMVPPIFQICKYLLNILPHLNLRIRLSLLTGP